MIRLKVSLIKISYRSAIWTQKEEICIICLNEQFLVLGQDTGKDTTLSVLDPANTFEKVCHGGLSKHLR